MSGVAAVCGCVGVSVCVCACACVRDKMTIWFPVAHSLCTSVYPSEVYDRLAGMSDSLVCGQLGKSVRTQFCVIRRATPDNSSYFRRKVVSCEVQELVKRRISFYESFNCQSRSLGNLFVIIEHVIHNKSQNYQMCTR